MDRQYQKAIKAFEEVLDRSREGGLSAKWPHMMLSQVYAELDRIEEARFHMEKLLQLDPKFNIEVRGKQNQFKNPEDNERELAAFARLVHQSERLRHDAYGRCLA